MPDQQKYTNKLKGAHILIIGGSSGIGYGVAEASLEHGARVTISSSNPTRIDSALSGLKASYPSAATSNRISSAVCDLSNESSIEENVVQLFKAVGSVDHIVYTAGDALATTPLADADLAFMKKAGMVRFFGPLLVAREGSKHLSPGPRSSITLTSGMVGERPLPNWAVVGSFASGAFGMARGLALDLKPVRVNCVVPGAVDTELWKGLSEEVKREMFREYESKMTTGRVGRVEDVVEAYLFAMRDENLTGSNIDTNGGNLLMG
ncbi:NAD(P)-binding protein [Saccharata proteae CBS 121410]|uniref:NAD(P)-binding protein n=1 Tax=Saccharata proteae CBS 121410 TaxID=1314787 RepID=A0A9P4HNC1_9PEZI|nr:NAD(P)-binding protein [Saccharata proteae CBS 121410]